MSRCETLNRSPSSTGTTSTLTCTWTFLIITPLSSFRRKKEAVLSWEHSPILSTTGKRTRLPSIFSKKVGERLWINCPRLSFSLPAGIMKCTRLAWPDAPSTSSRETPGRMRDCWIPPPVTWLSARGCLFPTMRKIKLYWSL